MTAALIFVLSLGALIFLILMAIINFISLVFIQCVQHMDLIFRVLYIGAAFALQLFVAYKIIIAISNGEIFDIIKNILILSILLSFVGTILAAPASILVRLLMGIVSLFTFVLGWFQDFIVFLAAVCEKIYNGCLNKLITITNIALEKQEKTE